MGSGASKDPSQATEVEGVATPHRRSEDLREGGGGLQEIVDTAENTMEPGEPRCLDHITSSSESRAPTGVDQCEDNQREAEVRIACIFVTYIFRASQVSFFVLFSRPLKLLFARSYEI
jgi:hypothetical protein